MVRDLVERDSGEKNHQVEEIINNHLVLNGTQVSGSIWIFWSPGKDRKAKEVKQVDYDETLELTRGCNISPKEIIAADGTTMRWKEVDFKGEMDQ